MDQCPDFYSHNIFRMKAELEIRLVIFARESLSGIEARQRKAHEKLWAQSSYPEDFNDW